jgi:hypothetical protein
VPEEHEAWCVTANTAAGHIAVLDAALAQLPAPLRRPDAEGRIRMLVRADAACATAALPPGSPSWVGVLRRRQLRHLDFHTADGMRVTGLATWSSKSAVVRVTV